MKFGKDDKAFADDPIERLNHALTYLCADPSELEVFYGDFVGRLEWGKAVDFNQARAAFNRLARQLLNNPSFG